MFLIQQANIRSSELTTAKEFNKEVANINEDVYKRQDEIIEKILKQKTFNQGFMTTELLAAAILDMNLHMTTDVRCV